MLVEQSVSLVVCWSVSLDIHACRFVLQLRRP